MTSTDLGLTSTPSCGCSDSGVPGLDACLVEGPEAWQLRLSRTR